MAIPKALGLTEDELDQLMGESWNMRIATHAPGGAISLTPLWFAWADQAVYAFCRGQKVEDLRRDPQCTVLVDENEKFPELRGVMMRGVAEILETEADEAADPQLAQVRAVMGEKYRGGHGDGPVPQLTASARGRNWRWICFRPTRLVSWDNHKLPARQSH